MKRAARPKVIIAARLAQDHGHGGHAWAMLNWILGGARLDWDVSLVEPTGLQAPDMLEQHAVRWATESLSSCGATLPYTVLDASGSPLIGSWTQEQLDDAVARADIVLNVSGVWRSPAIQDIGHRIYLDLDPGFTQWWAADGIDMGLELHSSFVTVGLGVGLPGCPVPTLGRTWIHSLPPVVIDQWNTAPSTEGQPYTTIANWRSYGTVWHEGERFGQKAHSIRALIDLPGRSSVPLEIALRIHPAERHDLDSLTSAGWRIVDPAITTATATAYRRYIRSSRGELGLAKEGYVAARTGWVSDRTACFLATGRPVVAQETGRIAELGQDEGLLAFTSTDDAAEALRRVESNWAHHAHQARSLAVRRFSHDVVLPSLLEQAA